MEILKAEVRHHKLKKDSTGIYLDGFKLKMVEDYQIEKPMGQSTIDLTIKICVKELEFSTN